MKNLDLNIDNILPFVSEGEIDSLQPDIDRLHQVLEEGRGAGSDFLGWLHLPSRTDLKALEAIEQTAASIRQQSEVFVCIGIGGSYLGAQAGLVYCKHGFANLLRPEQRGGPEIYFAGHNISSDYIADLLDVIGERDLSVNVISKSGTTTEPAIAFRIFKEILEKRYCADGARKRIVVTTDSQKGALRKMASEKGYSSFVIPDDVGGRFSVLTPVGLIPLAVAGIDLKALIEGAREAEEATTRTAALDENSAYRYAAIRKLFYLRGKSIEVMAAMHPAFRYVAEWWKQLAGESEGKNHRGIFPASVEYTTDLHSLGQWMQEGPRSLLETFLVLGGSNRSIDVPRFEDDADELNYLAGKSLDYVNAKAYQGTALAHREGGVPNMTLTVKDRSPYSLGQLFYFFERAIAISGYLLKVNPFNQPGVEFYKKNMFQLLDKPGFKKGSA